MKDAATLGGSALDYLTSLMGNPYEAYCKLIFENAIGIKNLMIPLQTSFTQSNKRILVDKPRMMMIYQIMPIPD